MQCDAPETDPGEGPQAKEINNLFMSKYLWILVKLSGNIPFGQFFYFIFKGVYS